MISVLYRVAHYKCSIFCIVYLNFRELEMLVDNLNAGRPQCPVGLNTLVVPRQAAPC